MKLICGVDLGGTKLSAALFDQMGVLIGKEITHDHVNETTDGIIRVISELVQNLLKNNNVLLPDIVGIGVGLAGHILYRKGIIITTSNFKVTFTNYPFVEKMKTYFPGVKILLDNDANVQALGESMYGAGKGFESMVFMTISTGVGAGIVLNGKLLRGKNGTAGEIGHSIIEYKSKYMCTCGNYGCAMAHSSGLFLPELYRYKLESGMTSSIGLNLDNISSFDGHFLKKGVNEGDNISISIMNESADIIGTSVFNIHKILDPDAVVLGGGLLQLGDKYMSRIKNQFSFLMQDMMESEMEIKLSEIGADAGLLGAASLLLE
ncbi:MAG: ROK family protein [Spirochaetia bacterium]|jgi:glucokinase|nr:ROK family protein [Spirochaetia bacterium]